MNSSHFIVYFIILFTSWTFFYSKVQRHFNNPDIYKKDIADLKEELAQEKFRNLLLNDQMMQFHMEVSKIIPGYLKEAPKGEKGYPLRNLASLVNTSDLDGIRVSKAKQFFERAKKEFRNGNFDVSRKMLLTFIDRMPYSIHITEAFFLLTEIHYRTENYERAILTVEKMLEIFPESELTGYALLRIGKIYEYQERPEEAVDIYQTVLKSFADRGIASQARKSLQSVQL